MITVKITDCHIMQQSMWRMLEKQNNTEYVLGILINVNAPDEDHLWQEAAGLSRPMGILGKLRLFASEDDAAYYRLARM